MAGYIGTQAVSVNTTSATISDDLAVGDDLTVTDDATIGGTALVTGVLTTTAATVFNGGFAAAKGSTVVAADGVADNAFAFQIKNEEATNDRSFGLLLNAGSTATDRALTINTHDGSDGLLYLQGNGQALFTDGTASLPSITNFGDLNTGMFFPAADALGLSTGGTERLRIASTGDVAIGSTTPEANTNFVALTVGPGASTGGGQVYVESSSVRAVFCADNNGADPKAVMGTTTNHPLVFFQNNADVGRFDASENFTVKTGNIIIGTAGKGIDFSNQASPAGGMTSELLDRYEEGTFTGTIFGGSTDGTYEIAAAGCHYTRIGNVVTCMFNIVLASSITAGGSGNMHFAGFPFPYDASLNTGDTNMCNVQGVDFNTNAIQLSFVRQSGSDTNVFVIAETLHNATQGIVQAGEFAANDTIRSTLTYFTLT